MRSETRRGFLVSLAAACGAMSFPWAIKRATAAPATPEYKKVILRGGPHDFKVLWVHKSAKKIIYPMQTGEGIKAVTYSGGLSFADGTPVTQDGMPVFWCHPY